MSKYTSKAFIIMVLIICAFSGSKAYAASVQTRKDNPADFNNILDSCSTEELGSLLDVLGEERPGGSSEYNTSVRKALVYRAYSKLTYLFRGERDIDYHGIVKWAAEENGISEQMIKALPTFHLERMIMEKYLADVWDKLTLEQKRDVLSQVEKEANIVIQNKSSIISTMAGIAAISAIKAAVAYFPGSSFYFAMTAFATSALKAIAGAVGVTLPIGVYFGMNTVLTKLVSFVAGPPGWVLMLASTAITIALPEKDRVSGFVMAIHAIKCAKYGE